MNSHYSPVAQTGARSHVYLRGHYGERKYLRAPLNTHKNGVCVSVGGVGRAAAKAPYLVYFPSLALAKRKNYSLARANVRERVRNNRGIKRAYVHGISHLKTLVVSGESALTRSALVRLAVFRARAAAATNTATLPPPRSSARRCAISHPQDMFQNFKFSLFIIFIRASLHARIIAFMHWLFDTYIYIYHRFRQPL